MSKVQQKHRSKKVCLMCGKTDSISLNRPHSLHKTKRVVSPNFQKKWGFEFCQNCYRTIEKRGMSIKDFGSRQRPEEKI